jgi:orotate phosphoribosyltransferase
VTDSVEEIFRKSGAVLEGHFQLASGLHSPVYWEKFQILQYPEYTEQLCRLIADHFRNRDVQVVAGPTTGGIILAYEVARQLGVRGIFAENRDDGGREFRRGFKIAPGERVLIVDDVFTRGGSLRDTIEAVNKLRGNIVGIGVLIDRSPEKIDFGLPFLSCHRAEVVTYKPEECPLCARGVPLVKPGSRQPKQRPAS